MNLFTDLAITSLDTITAFELVTKNYMFTLDELQDATIAQTEDTVDITGKAGRKLSTIKRNKAVTISGTNGLFSTGLLELQTGSKVENKAYENLWTEHLTINKNVATISYTAVGTAGAEITNLIIKDENGLEKERLTQGSEAAEGKFTYGDKEITFSEGAYEDGTEIVVYYKRKMESVVLKNLSDTYSGKCSLYVDATGEDKCGNVYRVQFYFPKVDFNGEFSIELGGDQVVHGFEASALSGACGSTDEFFTYVVFGANAADAE